jgi:hypothetical protein
VGLKITHQEMANLIGSTRETVSLTLSQFKRKGLIQTGGGRRVILSDLERAARPRVATNRRDDPSAAFAIVAAAAALDRHRRDRTVAVGHRRRDRRHTAVAAATTQP